MTSFNRRSRNLFDHMATKTTTTTTTKATKGPSSLPGFQPYPTNRDIFLKTAVNWINGKRQDDGYYPYWRVHDQLYDLTSFIAKHPGGSDWLIYTQGTDITEAFEASHLNPTVEKILAKYLVKPAPNSRNTPYTFEPDGFYQTLKKRAFSVLKQHPGSDPHVPRIHSSLFLAFVVGLFLSGYYQSLVIAYFTGMALWMLTNCSHSYFHLKDNWRMYGFDLSLLSSFEWRITHALSHHLYTNTIYDWEISGFEPYFIYLPLKDKAWWQKEAQVVMSHIFFPFAFLNGLLLRVLSIASGQQSVRWENLLPAVELAVLVVLTKSFGQGLLLWLVIQMTAGYWFAFVGLTAAHHHPDIFHDGDEPKYGMDWGLMQLDAVRDRYDVNGNLFLEAVMYGEHALHHLFPTVEHGKLHLLHDVFRQTCREFGIDDFDYIRPPYSQWELLVGMYKQCVRTSPRTLN